MKARPGEVSLAHHGVLFLDELPEFSRPSLEALRQPLESGAVTVARAQASLTYPARAQVIAAMNPCRCGYLSDPSRACSRAPVCGEDYRHKLSGPLLDRMDIVIDVPAVPVRDLMSTRVVESSSAIAARVRQARDRQRERYMARAESGADGGGDSARASSHKITKVLTNAHVPMDLMLAPGELHDEARLLLEKAVEHFRLSARGYHRVLRLARTIADLDQQDEVMRSHIAEAIAYRQEHGFARSADTGTARSGGATLSSRVKDEASRYAEDCTGN